MEILSLGEKIKQLRKENNMTLKDLAGDKVTPGQISLVESGKSKPSIDLLKYIAERLNISIDYILETEEHQAEKLCQYYSKIAEASLLAENFDQAREAISKGMAYAREYNLEYYIGLNELYMAKMDYGQNNYESAQNRLILANEIFLKQGKIMKVIDTYIYLGMTTYKLAYYNSALNFYKHAERILKENKILDNDILMKIYYNISQCYSKLDKYNASTDYLLLAMEKFKEKNDRLQYGQSLLMLSISYKSLKKFKEAISYADKAIETFQDLENKAFEAEIETKMGVMLSEIGNMEDSFNHLEKAYRIKQETGDKTIPVTAMRLADNYIKTNDTDKALNIINDVLNNYCHDEHSLYRPALYRYLYRIYMLKGDMAKAEMYLLEALRYLQNMDKPMELADIYISLGEFYEKSGKSEEALKFMNRGIKIYKDLGIILSNSDKHCQP